MFRNGTLALLFVALPFAGYAGRTFATTRGSDMTADTILFNGRVHTVDRENPQASAVAIKDGRFLAVGDDATVMATRGDASVRHPSNARDENPLRLRRTVA